MNINGIQFQCDFKFGSAELQQRIVLADDGGMAFQGRVIHKDEHGLIEKITPWSTTGILKI